MNKKITEKLLERYKIYLYEQEKSKATIQKYMCDLEKLMNYARGRGLTKTLIIDYKEYLRNEKNIKQAVLIPFW